MLIRRICTATAAVGALVAVPGCAAARTTTATGSGTGAATIRTATGTTTADAAGTPGSALATSAVNRLALAGLSRLGGTSNTVFSPWSIETALAMVDQGASGTTAKQFDALLGGASSPTALAVSNHALNTAFHSAVTAHGSAGPTLNAANALWVDAGVKLENPFTTTLSRQFGAAPQQTDFANPSAATQTINTWVSKETRGLIPSLMTPGEITAQTKLVLTNALYLNARWSSPFDPNKTAKRSFSTAAGNVTVPFMDSGQLSSFPYAKLSGYQAVALPYADSSLQYLAILPAAGKLSQLQTWLTPAHLSSLTAALKRQPVDLSMPKFSLSAATEMNSFLQGLGLTSAFGGGSQIDRIIKGQALAIQAVQHSATLKVAEKGTVAAAATGVSVAPTAIAAEGVILDLDHPFLVLIRDTKTGAIMFAARVANPAQS